MVATKFICIRNCPELERKFHYPISKSPVKDAGRSCRHNAVKTSEGKTDLEPAKKQVIGSSGYFRKNSPSLPPLSEILSLRHKICSLVNSCSFTSSSSLSESLKFSAGFNNAKSLGSGYCHHQGKKWALY